MESTSLTSPHKRLLALACVFAALLSACSAPVDHSDVSVYQPSNNAMQNVEEGLVQAASQNKLLLLVLGAQWCHDSRGLAENFENKQLASIIANNYHTVFVDVGYYNDLTQITQRFEQAHYYATPTVMIIEPTSMHLMNASDMSIWGNAHSIPLPEYIEYFTRYSSGNVPIYQPLPAQHVDAIKAFEDTHSKRLNKAYEVLIPNLKLEDNNEAASAQFIDQWREVKRYRTALQKDIQAIRNGAIDSPNNELVLPVYPAFSWE